MSNVSDANAGRKDFRTGVIDGMECFQEGWALVQDQYFLFLGITFVGMLIGGAIPIVLQGAMVCGIYICLLARMRGEEVPFDTLFKGFDFFVESLIAVLLTALVGALAVIPLGIGMMIMMLGLGSGEEIGAGIGFVFFLLMMLATVAFAVVINGMFMFIFPLLVDRKLSPMDAFSLSFSAGKANLMGIIMLMLIASIGGFISALFCGVGIYLYLPVLFAAQAVAYRKVFPDDAGGETGKPFMGAPEMGKTGESGNPYA